MVSELRILGWATSTHISELVWAQDFIFVLLPEKMGKTDLRGLYLLYILDNENSLRHGGCNIANINKILSYVLNVLKKFISF